MKVRVYFNLHKRLFSVMDCATRRVIAHKKSVILKDARFIVSEKGRQRVLKSKRKNVHAFAEGTLIEAVPEPPVNKWAAIGYNPYKAAHFFRHDSPDFARIGASNYASMYVAAFNQPRMYATV